jgi:glycerol-1-phosphate dehydrogenase [NAD(P)+]
MTPLTPGRKIRIPRLLHVATDCLADVGTLLAEHAFDTTRVLVGSGAGPSLALADEVVEGLRAGGAEVVHVASLEGRLEQVAQTAALIIEEDIALAVAVGGGRVLDTVKLAAARTRIDFISVPTTISNDGISSPVASIINRDGARRSHGARLPAGIVVDVRVIGEAPLRTLRAGIGDLASNLTAVLDWQLADRRGFEQFDAFSAMIAESAARPVLDLADLHARETHEIVAKGLLMSGLAMAAAGTSRPCSGAEHLISHALDALLGEDAAMHGEQVALGCLVSAAAHDSPLLGVLHARFAELGLPTTPADVGLTDAHLRAAIAAAPEQRPDRHTILSELDDGDVPALLERAFAPLAAAGPAA